MSINNELLFWRRKWERNEWHVDQVPGEYVHLESYMETFVHKDSWRVKKVWRVAELSTGMGFGTGNTKKAAIEAARKVVAEMGKETMLLAISQQLDVFTPFLQPDNPQPKQLELDL